MAKRPRPDLDLSPELPPTLHTLTNYNIYCGDGLYLELKQFRKVWYLNFTRYGEHADIKNRFNINLKQFAIFKKGVDAIEKHIKASGQ